MVKFKQGISKSIVSGYFVILLITAIASVISILQLEHNKRKFLEISEVYLPSITYLKEFEALSQESNNLIQAWIRVANKDEKERLKIIQEKEYPDLKFKLENLSESSSNADLQKKVAKVLTEFDNTIVYQKKIMKNLETPENNSNDSLVDASITLLENEIKPRYNTNRLYLKSLLTNEKGFLDKLEHELSSSYNYLDLLMILILVIIVIIGLLASYYATQSITLPILNLKDIITSLGKGEVPKVKLTNRKDEIGEMTLAIHSMIESIKIKTEFAAQTGKGNYSAEFKFLGDEDVLGIALVQMRNNLKRTSEEDAGRNWINAGLAQAGELLRVNNDGNGEFYNNIINFVAKYLNAGIGGLYLLNEDENAQIKLELKASYAFELNRFKVNKIALGEGLIGQAALEKNIIEINDVPDNYLKIKSGMGETNPRHIVIIPLVFENELKGVIELATLEKISKLQLEFVEVMARNIAITFDLNSRKSTTEKLLNDSRQLNEKLRLSQERLTTANRELQTFVYKASHDLKGPLSTMLGLINLALEESTESVDINYIRMISETATKLDKVLLALIKIMSVRDSAVKKETINFNTRIDKALQSLGEEIDAAHVKITRNITNNSTFVSDNEIIGYILQNIIENGIKYRDITRAEPFVNISVTDAKEGVKLSISDNGVGINETMKGKLFEMFFRGNSKSSGSGLGLYFVKNAVTKLGGIIEIASEEGVGTVVSLTLPSLMKNNN